MSSNVDDSTFRWDTHPKVRPVDVQPDPRSPDTMFLLQDPLNISPVMLTLSMPALHLVSLMDGTRSYADIRDEFERQTGHRAAATVFADLNDNLASALLLEDDEFERQYDALADSYRATPRTCGPLDAIGLDGPDAASAFDGLFSWTAPAATSPVQGLIAPHLDYPRGQPCYEAAYSVLRTQPAPRRVVILGTNHFGRSTAAVATGQAFETPLGTTPVDVQFLKELERRCDAPLREFELDHQREHSIELQVLLLQHLLGADEFQIVPVLCPSPCGDSGTAPHDGRGVDLGVFADNLAAMLKTAEQQTLVIAGADLSHCGRFFDEDPDLDDTFLERIAMKDHQVLDAVTDNDLPGFVDAVAGDDNATRICSAGCIYALRRALPNTTARLLHYHQVVNDEAQCHVSCAAVVFEQTPSVAE